MYFENKCIKNGKVVEIKEIKMSIPVLNDELLYVTTGDRELIHIFINRNILMDYFTGNPDFIYERIFQILIKSKNISIENKCGFANWQHKAIRFEDCKHRTCSPQEKQEFILNQGDRIVQRINGNYGLPLQEYLNIIKNFSMGINLNKENAQGKIDQ